MRSEVLPLPILVDSDTEAHAGNEPEHVDDDDEVVHILEPKNGSNRAVSDESSGSISGWMRYAAIDDASCAAEDAADAAADEPEVDPSSDVTDIKEDSELVHKTAKSEIDP
jgi:hypothetical protein